MATYGQWLKNRKVTRVAWVCGEESALVRSVRDAYRDALPGAQLEYVWGDEEGAWDRLLTSSSAPRLSVVWQAQALKSIDVLPHLLGEEFDGSYALFASTEDDFRRSDRQLVPALAALRDSRHGQIIRCCAPADEEERAGIVASWWPGAGRNVAAALLDRCGGSLDAAWHAVDKAIRAGVVPEERYIPTVCAVQAGEGFADLLAKGNKRAAMEAARDVLPGEEGAVISLLASRLQLLPLLREAASRGEAPQETARRLRADPWVLRQMRPMAGSYPPARVERCRELLAMAETAWRSGARHGVLEAVAALW